MSVTPLYAGILGLWLLVLSVRVIQARRSAGVNLGHADDRLLERRIRAQANLIEYGPMILLLIGILDLSGVSPLVLHGLGLLLVAGRLMHGWALSFTEGNVVGRVGGMGLTLTVLGLAAVNCLIIGLTGTG